jgi:hypothetical protein
MTRWLACLLILLVVGKASATPELAESWGREARRLHTETSAQLGAETRGAPAPLRKAYFAEVARFAVTAARLGSWNDAAGGPADFGCIFRGMAEEAELQSAVLETATGASPRLAALQRLTSLFDDAAEIADAAAAAVRQKIADDSIPLPCPANPAAMQALLRD